MVWVTTGARRRNYAELPRDRASLRAPAERRIAPSACRRVLPGAGLRCSLCALIQLRQYGHVTFQRFSVTVLGSLALTSRWHMLVYRQPSDEAGSRRMHSKCMSSFIVASTRRCYAEEQLRSANEEVATFCQ